MGRTFSTARYATMARYVVSNCTLAGANLMYPDGSFKEMSKSLADGDQKTQENGTEEGGE